MRQLFRRSIRTLLVATSIAALGLCALFATAPATQAQEIIESQVFDEYQLDYGSQDGSYTFDSEQGFSDGGSCDDCDCDGCEECEEDGCCVLNMCRRWQNRRREANWFSCSCNGSYKFPVPPLYTYHWPGLYQLERMTDYQSPWRFPPIKPYAPEPQFEDQAFHSAVIQTAAVEEYRHPVAPRRRVERVRRSGPERASVKLKRAFGITE